MGPPRPCASSAATIPFSLGMGSAIITTLSMHLKQFNTIDLLNLHDNFVLKSV